ncbi:MAG: stress-induced protein [Proteobacteria bacterium]|nr:stress-induced protein [Pseudomonadota bacterium]
MAQPRTTSTSQTRALRGFALLDAARRREIASMGGQSVPEEKRSFSQDRELAAQAGRKGGQKGRGSRLE